MWREWIHCSVWSGVPVDQGRCFHQEGLVVNKEWWIFETRQKFNVQQKNKIRKCISQGSLLMNEMLKYWLNSSSVRFWDHRLLHTAVSSRWVKAVIQPFFCVECLRFITVQVNFICTDFNQGTHPGTIKERTSGGAFGKPSVRPVGKWKCNCQLHRSAAANKYTQ